MKRNIIIGLFFFIFAIEIKGENTYVDSLLNVLKSTSQDTVKINALKKLLWNAQDQSEHYKAVTYSKQLIPLCEDILNRSVGSKDIFYRKRILANIYSDVSDCYRAQGNYSEALKDIFIANKLFSEINEKGFIADSYMSIGGIYLLQKNYSEALINFQNALKIYESNNDKANTSILYYNISIIYSEQHQFDKALNYLLLSIKLKKELGNKLGIALCYNAIAEDYNVQSKYEDALKYYLDALAIVEELKNNYQKAICSLNLGNIYTKIGIKKNDQQDKEKDYLKAEEYLLTSIGLFGEMQITEGIKEYYQNMVMLDTARGKYKQAFEDHTQYVKYKDSLINEDNIKETERLKMQYEYDKKEIDQKREAERKAAEIQRKAQVQYMGVLVFLVLVFVFIFIAGRVQLSEKVISWSGFIGALLLFEFVLALLEPTINNYTNGLPVLFMVINISLAICIKPVHHFIETRLIAMAKRLKEKRSKEKVNN